MQNQSHVDKNSKQWSKADKINGAGVLVAILALIGGVALPSLWHLHNYWQRPQVSIKWPAKSAQMADNTFGANGTATHIPADSDLWLIVRSDGDGRWYPTERLPVTKGSWQIPENSICPAPGSQELVIYSIPDSEEGPLFAYLNSKAGRNGLGMNSVPIGSVVMASATVNVAKSKIAGC
jgi:hypothetical protein